MNYVNYCEPLWTFLNMYCVNQKKLPQMWTIVNYCEPFELRKYELCTLFVNRCEPFEMIYNGSQ